MYVLRTDDFLKDLESYEKPEIISKFTQIHSECTDKSVLALKEMNNITALLDFWLDYSTERDSVDLFWGQQYNFSRELEKIPPRKMERRLF